MSVFAGRPKPADGDLCRDWQIAGEEKPMCPFCLAAAALIAVSVTSTGGLAAIAIKKFGVKNAANNCSVPSSSKEGHHV
jgi:hypothetical protein